MRKSITNRLISLTEIDIRQSKTQKFSTAALKNTPNFISIYLYTCTHVPVNFLQNYMYFEGKFIQLAPIHYSHSVFVVFALSFRSKNILEIHI